MDFQVNLTCEPQKMPEKQILTKWQPSILSTPCQKDHYLEGASTYCFISTLEPPTDSFTMFCHFYKVKNYVMGENSLRETAEVNHLLFKGEKHNLEKHYPFRAALNVEI